MVTHWLRQRVAAIASSIRALSYVMISAVSAVTRLRRGFHHLFSTNKPLGVTSHYGKRASNLIYLRCLAFFEGLLTVAGSASF